MKFSKKFNYALFGFLIFLNIAIRYPFVPHEIGVDSFGIHSYANSISGFGYATWIIHPYSYLGLTPDSYPSAVPFLLSGMSQTTNINMEFTILLFAIIIGILGLFGSSFLAKQIYNDDLFIFFVAFLYSTSPIFLRFTFWTTSTRHLFMGLFPFFLWGLLRLRAYSELRWKYVGLSLFLFIMLISIHRLGLLLFLIIGAFIVTTLIIRSSQRLEYNKIMNRSAPFIWITLVILFILMQIMNIGIYRQMNISYSYQTGFIFKGDNPSIILFNMMVDYSSRVGILFLFGIIGFGMIFIKRNRSKSIIRSKRNFNEIFMILIFLFSSSVILLGIYLTLFLLPFLVVLVGLGVVWTIKYIRKSRVSYLSKHKSFIISLFLISILLISLFFTNFMIQHWFKRNELTDESVWIEDETIDTAYYIVIYKENYTFFSNWNRIIGRINSRQDEPLNYEIDLGEISIEKGGIIDLITHDTLYVKKGGTDERVYIPTKACDDERTIGYLQKNGIKFLIEKNSISKKIVSYGHSGLQDSTFLNSTHEKRYSIYENSLVTVWHV